MTEPIRILYVHNGADLYGASRSLVRLLGGLDRKRFLPLVVLPETGPLQDRIEREQVEVLIHPGLSVITRRLFRSWRVLLWAVRFPWDVWSLRRLIRRRGIELVHTNTGVVVSPALASAWARVPHVWHVRDWFQEFAPVWRFYSAYILRFSQRVIAVSGAVASQFPASERLRVIHNGFSLEEFAVPKAELREKFRRRHALGEAFVVGCVGRIKLVRKGQEILVQAAALLKQRGIPVKYLVVGAPFPGNENHLEILRGLIREEQLEADFILTGELADAREAYAAMDALVLPSVQPEPFGGVVMEAMALGLPVIATALGGSVDQVAEGVTGFLVEPGRPEALADRIATLWRDPLLRRHMSQAGPRRIKEHFGLEEMVRQLSGLYEEVLGADRDQAGKRPL